LTNKTEESKRTTFNNYIRSFYKIYKNIKKYLIIYIYIKYIYYYYYFIYYNNRITIIIIILLVNKNKKKKKKKKKKG